MVTGGLAKNSIKLTHHYQTEIHFLAIQNSLRSPKFSFIAQYTNRELLVRPLEGIHMKSVALAIILIIVPVLGYSAEWTRLNGIYIGMSATKVKNMGFTACTPPDPNIKQPHFHAFDVEHCRYVEKETKLFYGEKIKVQEIGIYSGKVESISIETGHEHGDVLKNGMLRKYGKPKGITKEGVGWEKGLENVGLVYLDNGNYLITAITYANIPK